MKTITVSLGERSYRIVLGKPLNELGGHLAASGLARRVFIVTNTTVGKRYLSALAGGCTRRHIAVDSVIIPDGERHKTLATVNKLYAAALKAGVDRATCVVALGGGVVGDIAGFFAATYLRGLPCVQVPTSLLAMVDSSVGGKTGVDLPGGKNLVGAFHQPRLVWIDPSTLNTLPARHLRNGLAEVIKYGVIRDAALFARVEKLVAAGPLSVQRQAAPLETIIRDCCAIKARVVEKDEHETRGLREILNFGHTFGHALETATKYRTYLHGEAVAVGMAMAVQFAVARGMLAAHAAGRITGLITRAGLPTTAREAVPEELVRLMRRDKKASGGAIRFILPTAIGAVTAVSFPDAKDIIKLLKAGGTA